MVPKELKEGAYSLGGTRLDVIRRVIFPVAGSGIFASYILALGRALGETMAVTMLIGNTNILPTSFTSTGNTMASVIANQFGEADGLKLTSQMMTTNGTAVKAENRQTSQKNILSLALRQPE